MSPRTEVGRIVRDKDREKEGELEWEGHEIKLRNNYTQYFTHENMQEECKQVQKKEKKYIRNERQTHKYECRN